VKLQAKTQSALRGLWELVSGRIKHTVEGVERGQVSARRPKLITAATHARENGLAVLVPDLSRLIRAESYHRHKNPGAVPTAEEFARLHELTLGVPLVTVAAPDLTETQRHAATIKRSGKAGRKRRFFSDKEAEEIFYDLGNYYLTFSGWRWENSLAFIARGCRYRVSPSMLDKLADTMSPYGITWRQRAIDRATREGWHKAFPGGKFGPLHRAENYWPARFPPGYFEPCTDEELAAMADARTWDRPPEFRPVQEWERWTREPLSGHRRLLEIKNENHLVPPKG
jgi:hypothetical protein